MSKKTWMCYSLKCHPSLCPPPPPPAPLGVAGIIFRTRMCFKISGIVDEEIVAYSLSFQVHARLWPCWRVVCNCGVAVREDNDVVTIDMCHGPWRRTSPRVIQKSRRPLGNRMRIRRYGSGQSTRFKVCDIDFFCLARLSNIFLWRSSSSTVGCRAGDYELPPATTILCQFR